MIKRIYPQSHIVSAEKQTISLENMIQEIVISSIPKNVHSMCQSSKWIIVFFINFIHNSPSSSDFIKQLPLAVSPMVRINAGNDWLRRSWKNGKHFFFDRNLLAVDHLGQLKVCHHLKLFKSSVNNTLFQIDCFLNFLLVSWLVGSSICTIAVVRVRETKFSFKSVDSLRTTRILGGTIVTKVSKNSLNLNFLLRPIDSRVCGSCASSSVAHCATIVMNYLVVPPRMMPLISSIRIEYDDIVGRISSDVSIICSMIPTHVHDLLIFLFFVLLIIVILAFKQLHLF